MLNLICRELGDINKAYNEIDGELFRIIKSGKAGLVSIKEATAEDADEQDRSLAQNRLIYKIYQRIGRALYGGDELHARRECKLKCGCKILYRDRQEFAETFDLVIRPLPQETRLKAMDLIEVSSIMKVKQSTEYIKLMMQVYTEQGVYFMDLEGIEDYANYPERQK
jgi:hypothetical protein